MYSAVESDTRKAELAREECMSEIYMEYYVESVAKHITKRRVNR